MTRSDVMKSILSTIALLACSVVVGAKDQRVWLSERSDYRDKVTGTEIWRLTTDPEVEIIPDRIKEVFSPDGSKMLFRSKRNGAWHLYVMEANGSKITRVSNQPTIYGVWSRTGASLICAPTVNNRAELHEVDVNVLPRRIVTLRCKDGQTRRQSDGTGVLFTRFIKQPKRKAGRHVVLLRQPGRNRLH